MQPSLKLLLMLVLLGLESDLPVIQSTGITIRLMFWLPMHFILQVMPGQVMVINQYLDLVDGSALLTICLAWPDSQM